MTDNSFCAKIAISRGGGEMVDALALGASEATHEGSSPFLGTKQKNAMKKARSEDLAFA